MDGLLRPTDCYGGGVFSSSNSRGFLCGSWRGCNGPGSSRFIVLGGGLWALLRVPVLPAGEVLSSPQMLGEDNETKAGIFPGKVIKVDHGKLYTRAHVEVV